MRAGRCAAALLLLLLSGAGRAIGSEDIVEVDDFFEQEKNFLINYYNRIKDSCAKADKMTRSHKNVADDYIHTAACLHSLALEEPTVIKKADKLQTEESGSISKEPNRNV